MSFQRANLFKSITEGPPALVLQSPEGPPFGRSRLAVLLAHQFFGSPCDGP